MTRAATPKLSVYLAIAALALLTALSVRRPELVAVAAPFALAVGVGLTRIGEPELDAAVTLDRERALEGEEVLVEVELSAPAGAERFEVLLELPHELAAPDNPRVLHLADGDERDLSYRLACRRWGGFRVGRIFVQAHDVFGFVRHETVLDRCRPLKVYPHEEAVRRLVLPLETQVFAGNHVARQKGEGIEFADLRAFVPGDRVRHVNWRASARRGELWVNEHHAERNADVVIFLDSFAEARRGRESTLDPALRAAATLVDRYLQEKDRVGFVSFGGMLNWLLPSTGTRQLYRVVEAMLDTQIVLSYAWRDVDVIPPRTLPPRALVLALTPLLDDRSTSALLDLRGRGFDLVVVEISPETFLPDPKGEVQELARRLWKLRRDAVRGRFERAGVPVAVWGEGEPLAGALGEVSSYRRHGRLVRA